MEHVTGQASRGSPRTRGQKRVAQGESASPGKLRVEHPSPRTRGRQRLSRLKGRKNKITTCELVGYAVAREYAGWNQLGARVPRARGLALGYTLSPASTRAGIGLGLGYPGLADSPWATRCRPRVRGLESAWGSGTQGSRTRPGLHAVAREYAGWNRLGTQVPRARGLALGYRLSPASTRAGSSLVDLNRSDRKSEEIL